jgi:hypothetical protein
MLDQRQKLMWQALMLDQRRKPMHDQVRRFVRAMGFRARLRNDRRS